MPTVYVCNFGQKEIDEKTIGENDDRCPMHQHFTSSFFVGFMCLLFFGKRKLTQKPLVKCW